MSEVPDINNRLLVHLGMKQSKSYKITFIKDLEVREYNFHNGEEYIWDKNSNEYEIKLLKGEEVIVLNMRQNITDFMANIDSIKVTEIGEKEADDVSDKIARLVSLR